MDSRCAIKATPVVPLFTVIQQQFFYLLLQNLLNFLQVQELIVDSYYTQLSVVFNEGKMSKKVSLQIQKLVNRRKNQWKYKRSLVSLSFKILY